MSGEERRSIRIGMYWSRVCTPPGGSGGGGGCCIPSWRVFSLSLALFFRALRLPNEVRLVVDPQFIIQTDGGAPSPHLLCKGGL